MIGKGQKYNDNFSKVSPPIVLGQVQPSLVSTKHPKVGFIEMKGNTTVQIDIFIR